MPGIAILTSHPRILYLFHRLDYSGHSGIYPFENDIRCQTCNTSKDLSISAYPDKGYLMDDCTVSRNSTNYHVLIMISWRRSTNISFTQKLRRRYPSGCFSLKIKGINCVLKHDHTVTMIF